MVKTFAVWVYDPYVPTRFIMPCFGRTLEEALKNAGLQNRKTELHSIFDKLEEFYTAEDAGQFNQTHV